MRPGDLVARECTRPAAICFSGFAGMMSGARRHDGVGAAGPALEPKGQDEDSRGSRGRRSSSTAILPNLGDVVVVVVDVVAVVVFVVVVLLRTLRPDAPPAHAQVHREQGLLSHRPR